MTSMNFIPLKKPTVEWYWILYSIFHYKTRKFCFLLYIKGNFLFHWFKSIEMRKYGRKNRPKITFDYSVLKMYFSFLVVAAKMATKLLFVQSIIEIIEWSNDSFRLTVFSLDFLVVQLTLKTNDKYWMLADRL